MKCEACGKHPAAYTCDSYTGERPPVRICCVCADVMIMKIPNAQKDLNIKEIQNESTV